MATKRKYVVTITNTSQLTVEAVSAEDAEDQAEMLLADSSHSFHGSHVQKMISESESGWEITDCEREDGETEDDDDED